MQARTRCFPGGRWLALSFTAAVGLSACRAPTPGRGEAALRTPRAAILYGEGRAGGSAARPYQALLAAMGIGTDLLPVTALARLTPSRDLLLVAPADSTVGLAAAELDRLVGLVAEGSLLVAEGITPLTARFGFREGAAIDSAALEEVAFPDVAIAWAAPLQMKALVPPSNASVLTVERASRAVVAAEVAYGRGRVIVLAVPLDVADGQGFGRYPYLPQALVRAGLRPRFRSPRLWAFFDYGYRGGADLEALAERWLASGIAAVHVGAWDFWEPEPAKDAYLARLLAAAHRRGILVYAWLEFPHVSTAIWERHPEWREKTATQADAHLDWRYLMNLANPACARAVTQGLEHLLARFDWDGVNLAELYFDSPMGPSEPAQMTPFNDDVRRAYRAEAGVDPVDFFRPSSPHYWRKDARAWAAFVDYRVELERALNEKFLDVLARVRAQSKPDLGVALTYVDNLYDASMREAVGADVDTILPLLTRHDLTLVIEDPMTTWHLGPERYSQLARRYRERTPHFERLGIDINVVERSAPVFPTATQTGGELLELLYHAGKSFSTVMVYGEQTILEHDLGMLAYGLAGDVTVEPVEGGLSITSRYPLVFTTDLAGRRLQVDGKSWPAVSGGDVLLPAGKHVVSAGTGTIEDSPHLVRLSGRLEEVRYGDPRTIVLAYESPSRVYAAFDAVPISIESAGRSLPVSGTAMITLPRGRHTAYVRFAPRP